MGLIKLLPRKILSKGSMPTGLIVVMFATSILGLAFSFRVLQVSTTAKKALAASPSPGGGSHPTSTPKPQATSTPKPQATSTPKPQPSGGGGPQPTKTPTPKPGGGSQPTNTPTPKPGGGGSQPTNTPTPKPGGGGGNTPTPTSGAASDCLTGLAVEPQTVDRNGSFKCSFNYGNKLSGAHLMCAITQNGLLVSGKNLYGNDIGCKYDKTDTQSKIVKFNCIAPDTAGAYEIQGYLDPVSKQSNPPIESMPAGCPQTPLTTGLCIGGGCTNVPTPTGSPTPTPPASCTGLFGKYN